MPKVVTVRLRYVAKDYWFDPAGIAVEEGDHVLVQTVKGKEIGLCTGADIEVQEKDIATPLKPVLRVATEDDLAQAERMAARGEDAMPKFRELVEKNELDMKPIRVEFTFTGDYATFFFAADERVDFRGLIKDLAAEFHVRVDMRQIGVRDEARMLGGLGHCGEELCCARMGGDFQPVSIRMAKEQDLPLNPTKISGLCGRLMCCLRYEFEAYKDFKGRAPKKNAMIDTPMGLAKVVEFDTPRERIRLRMEDGSSMVVPLSSMDTEGAEKKTEGKQRPCHIGQDAWDNIIEELNSDKRLAVMGDKLFSDDPNLADKTTSAGVVERTPRKRKKKADNAEDEGGLLVTGSSRDAKPRRRRRGESTPEPEGRNPRTRRRSVSVSGNSERSAARKEQAEQTKQKKAQANGEGKEQAQKQDGQRTSSSRRRRRKRGGGSGGQGAQQSPEQQKQQSKQSSKPRPGQNSSTLHGNNNASSSDSAEKSSKPHKRRRRRRGGRGNGGGSESAGNAGASE